MLFCEQLLGEIGDYIGLSIWKHVDTTWKSICYLNNLGHVSKSFGIMCNGGMASFAINWAFEFGVLANWSNGVCALLVIYGIWNIMDSYLGLRPNASTKSFLWLYYSKRLALSAESWQALLNAPDIDDFAGNNAWDVLMTQIPFGFLNPCALSPQMWLCSIESGVKIPHWC